MEIDWACFEDAPQREEEKRKYDFQLVWGVMEDRKILGLLAEKNPGEESWEKGLEMENTHWIPVSNLGASIVRIDDDAGDDEDDDDDDGVGVIDDDNGDDIDDDGGCDGGGDDHDGYDSDGKGDDYGYGGGGDDEWMKFCIIQTED